MLLALALGALPSACPPGGWVVTTQAPAEVLVLCLHPVVRLGRAVPAVQGDQLAMMPGPRQLCATH